MIVNLNRIAIQNTIYKCVLKEDGGAWGGRGDLQVRSERDDFKVLTSP